MQFIDQIRKNRYNQSVVHTIKETGDECHDDDGTNSCLWIHVETVTPRKAAVKRRSVLIRKRLLRLRVVAVDRFDNHGLQNAVNDCVSFPFLVFVRTLSTIDVADNSFQRE